VRLRISGSGRIIGRSATCHGAFVAVGLLRWNASFRTDHSDTPIGKIRPFAEQQKGLLDYRAKRNRVARRTESSQTFSNSEVQIACHSSCIAELTEFSPETTVLAINRDPSCGNRYLSSRWIQTAELPPALCRAGKTLAPQAAESDVPPAPGVPAVARQGTSKQWLPAESLYAWTHATHLFRTVRQRIVAFRLSSGPS
jgi:hypothetical protein